MFNSTAENNSNNGPKWAVIFGGCAMGNLAFPHIPPTSEQNSIVPSRVELEPPSTIFDDHGWGVTVQNIKRTLCYMRIVGTYEDGLSFPYLYAHPDKTNFTPDHIISGQFCSPLLEEGAFRPSTPTPPTTTPSTPEAPTPLKQLLSSFENPCLTHAIMSGAIAFVEERFSNAQRQANPFALKIFKVVHHVKSILFITQEGDAIVYEYGLEPVFLPRIRQEIYTDAALGDSFAILKTEEGSVCMAHWQPVHHMEPRLMPLAVVGFEELLHLHSQVRFFSATRHTAYVALKHSGGVRAYEVKHNSWLGHYGTTWLSGRWVGQYFCEKWDDLSFLRGVFAHGLSSGRAHTALWTPTRLFLWGDNTHGQLSWRPEGLQDVPQHRLKVYFLKPSESIFQVIAQENTTLILLDNDKLPSLQKISALTACQHGLDPSRLPEIIRNEFF